MYSQGPGLSISKAHISRAHHPQNRLAKSARPTVLMANQRRTWRMSNISTPK